MAVETSRSGLIQSLSILFYMSTFAGLMPYSLRVFISQKTLKISIISNIFVLISLVHSIVQYHFASFNYSFGVADSTVDSGTLTLIIGIVILYMEPLMLFVDAIGFVINQRKMIALMDRMQRIDDRLLKENITIDYRSTKRMTIVLIVIVSVFEIGIVTYNYFLFQDVMIRTLLWFTTCIPLYFSSLAKIWYITLVFNVKQKFAAINDHFESTGNFFEELKKRREPPSRDKMGDRRGDGGNLLYTGTLGSAMDADAVGGYLHREIHIRHKSKKAEHKVPHGMAFTITPTSRDGVLQVQPKDTAHDNSNIIHSCDKNEQRFTDGLVYPTGNNSILLVESRLNQKLTKLCEVHDEICDVAKIINQMFSLQMLILMAYGFMSLTAKFYFVYCGQTRQAIPLLFRAAENIPESVAFIVYTAAKCVYVIYVSWQTKLVAQKTGVKLHRVANVVDENQCYQVVNHLSLKLLNHHLSFTACGFFELDMTTLYAITGAITSYLIILIQFNLAAQRTKKTGVTANNTTAIANTTV